jgi:O-antigen/teichoic acid export membrane protein
MTGVKKSFAYQSMYQVTSMLLPLVTSPYLARTLGAEKIGVYSYSYAISFYFMMFALLGIGNYGNKAIASARDNPEKLNKTFSSLLYIHVFFCVIALLAYYVFVCTFVMNERFVLLIQGLWIFSALFDVSWFFFGMERFKVTAICNTIAKIVMTAFVFLFVKTTNDVWIYCLIMGGGTLCSQLVLWPLMKNYVKIVWVPWKELKPHIAPMVVLFIPVIAISLYRYVDKIMLGVISTKSEVGYFENAEKAMGIPVSVINSFGIVMLSRMSNIFSKDREKEGLVYIGKSIEWIMCFTCAMAFGMCAVAKNFSVLFWGEGFERSGYLLQYLCVSILFMCFANVLRTQYLIPKGKNSCYVVSVGLGALVNIVVNVIMIPKYGAYGAVLGTVCAEAMVCLVQMYCVRREIPLFAYVKKSLIFVFFGGLMYLPVKYVGAMCNNLVMSLFVQIAIGMLVYLVLSCSYFAATKNDVFKAMLERVKSK